MRVRLAGSEDGAAIAQLYAPFVTGTAISLEERPPDAAEMAARIASGGTLYPWLVAEADGAVIGYASAGPHKARSGYRFTVATSVYVSKDFQRRGAGRHLYGTLITLLVLQGYANAVAAITLPNESSVAFHEKFEFESCGRLAQIGWKLGLWWDVGLWQCRLGLPPDPPPDDPRPYAGFADVAGLLD